jgi:hypothetical protein
MTLAILSKRITGVVSSRRAEATATGIFHIEANACSVGYCLEWIASHGNTYYQLYRSNSTE